jgi:pilus assembly protein CpaB
MRKPKKIFVQFAVAAGIAGLLAVIAVVLAVAVINGSQGMARIEVAKATEAAKKAKAELDKQIAENAEKRKLTVREVRAAVNIPPETPIESSMITVEEVPQSTELLGRISNPQDVIGKMLRVALPAGQALLDRQLISFNDPSMLRSGYRMMTVQIDPVGGLNGDIQPGSRVDVLATVKVDDDSITRTLLQNVMVLSVNFPPGMTPAPRQVPNINTPTSLLSDDDQRRGGAILKNLMNGTMAPNQPVSTSLGNDKNLLVGLMVTPKEAEKLALANQQGKFHLTMRGIADHNTAMAPGMEINQLMGLPKPNHDPPEKPMPAPRPAPLVQNTQKIVATPTPEAPKRVFTMEVLKGASAETKNFDLE